MTTSLLQNRYARMALVGYLVYRLTGQAVISAVLAAALVLILEQTGSKCTELFTLLNPMKELSVRTGCDSLTMKDVSAMFSDDTHMTATFRAAKVPLNMAPTDENAPVIATYLANHGIVVTPSCSPYLPRSSLLA